MNMLHYKILGEYNRHDGVVVLLHGLFGMSDNLLLLARELATSCCVLVPDLVNHGLSPHRPGMSYPQMATDVFDLLDSLGIKSLAVVGHSMGGKVAMQMASMHPERVQKLVVADIAPVAYEARHLAILEIMQKIAGLPIAARKQAETIMAEVIAEPQLRQFFLKNMYRDQGFWKWRFGLQEISKAYPAICSAPDMQKVFHGETLFVKGELSDYILPAHEQVIKSWFPLARLKVIQGAGHWLHAEKPAAFNRLLVKFLAA